MAVFLSLETTTKWQSICYTKYSSQNGSLSVIQNIYHKMAVPPLFKNIYHKMAVPPLPKHSSQNGGLSAIHNIQKWQFFCHLKHPQDDSLSATQNIHHKMAVSLLLKTFITRWQSLRY